MKKKGDKRDPCGSPLSTWINFHTLPFYTNINFRLTIEWLSGTQLLTIHAILQKNAWKYWEAFAFSRSAKQHVKRSLLCFQDFLQNEDLVCGAAILVKPHFLFLIPLLLGVKKTKTASWSRGNAFSLEREVPIKSDILLPTACHCCEISSKGAVLPAGAMTRTWAPQTPYALRRNAASLMRFDFDLVVFRYFLSRIWYLLSLEISVLISGCSRTLLAVSFFWIWEIGKITSVYHFIGLVSNFHAIWLTRVSWR